MRETERQIQAYKARLPHMRERVTAALALLVVAAIMMVSTSYAWVVLSTSPEIKGINTTITANGNLEIALANGTEITEPADSAVGDGGKDLVAKNITWGNLVNLGDPAYGLENIVLRPAQLNTNSLLESPLYGASYGADGRVDILESDFAYAYWNVDTFTADKELIRYGVRAVSSVTYGAAPGQDMALADAVRVAENATISASSNLQALATHAALQDLVGLMGDYVNAQVNEKLYGSEPIVEVDPDQVNSILYLMTELKKNVEECAEATAAIYNVEMLRRTKDQQYVTANKFTGTYLLTETQANIQSKLAAKNSAGDKIVQPAMLNQLWQLRTDYNTLIADIAVIETYVGRDDVVYRNLNGSTYPAIETYVNHIAEVSSCTVNGTAIGSLSMSNIGSLTGGGTKPIVIHRGIIQRMDKYTGAQIKSNTLTITVMGSTARGQATTSAASPYVLPSEQERALGADTSYKGSNPIAGDTFGLALDFFLRTNADNAYLTLQGSPVYEERDETVIVTVGQQNYTLYKVEVTEGEETVEKEAYLEDDTYYAYDRSTGIAGEALGTTEEITSATVVTEKVKYVVGYSGVNRVWDSDESAYLDEQSTTQGAGSCYVFYPQNPEDQEKFLQLLKHMNIAFIDQNGNKLGDAVMDTENVFEQPGKVTVPLVAAVTNNSVTDIDGNPVYTITKLEQNVPTFITALVYLDGSNLTNDQVLAANDIQGQLNIQFGTTADLNAMDDPILMEEQCVVTATMEGRTSASIEDPIANRTKRVTVTVSGYEPQRVQACFSREISSTQGIRQELKPFTSNGDGTWSFDFAFENAGKYILREVILDGVTYELDQEPIVFTVEGLTISSVFCADNGKTYMTTEKRFDTSVSLTVSASEEWMPTSVKGAFIHTETKNRTTVYFTRNGGTWTGDATFTTSGEYRLEYVELDGEYTGLSETQHVSFKLNLGLTASIYTGDNNINIDEVDEVDVSMVIRSDNGESIENLSDVWLEYVSNNPNTPESLGADMVWNSSRDRYEGTFHLEESGIYNFNLVQIEVAGENSYLYAAAVAPTITAISQKVPVYVSKAGLDGGEVFSLNNDTTFSITMDDADAATMDAKLTDASGNVYYVRGTNANSVFTFTLPVVNGSQDGIWTLNEVYLTNVNDFQNGVIQYRYDTTLPDGPLPEGDENLGERAPYTVADGYYADNWWTWTLDDLTGEGEATEAVITVVSNIDIGFTASELNASKNFGKDASGNVTGTFGQNHTLNNLELQITAGSGQLLSDYGLKVSAVNLQYTYDTTCLTKVNNETYKNTYGGDYTVASNSWSTVISGDRGAILYTLGSNSGSSYTLTTTNSGLSVAGRYKVTKLEVIVTRADGSGAPLTVTVPETGLNAAPVYTVWSKKPVATITGISPTGSNPAKVTWTTQNTVTFTATGNETSEYSAHAATLYAVATADNSTQKHGSYTRPTLSITLSGMGGATSATMILPAGDASVVNFNYDSDKKVTMTLGSLAQIKTWPGCGLTHTLDKYNGHGTQTINQVTMTMYGITCTFELDNPLVITNPSSVNQTS